MPPRPPLIGASQEVHEHSVAQWKMSRVHKVKSYMRQYPAPPPFNVPMLIIEFFLRSAFALAQPLALLCSRLALACAECTRGTRDRLSRRGAVVDGPASAEVTRSTSASSRVSISMNELLNAANNSTRLLNSTLFAGTHFFSGWSDEPSPYEPPGTLSTLKAETVEKRAMQSFLDHEKRHPKHRSVSHGDLTSESEILSKLERLEENLFANLPLLNPDSSTSGRKGCSSANGKGGSSPSGSGPPSRANSAKIKSVAKMAILGIDHRRASRESVQSDKDGAGSGDSRYSSPADARRHSIRRSSSMPIRDLHMMDSFRSETSETEERPSHGTTPHASRADSPRAGSPRSDTRDPEHDLSSQDGSFNQSRAAGTGSGDERGGEDERADRPLDMDGLMRRLSHLGAPERGSLVRFLSDSLLLAPAPAPPRSSHVVTRLANLPPSTHIDELLSASSCVPASGAPARAPPSAVHKPPQGVLKKPDAPDSRAVWQRAFRKVRRLRWSAEVDTSTGGGLAAPTLAPATCMSAGSGARQERGNRDEMLQVEERVQGEYAYASYASRGMPDPSPLPPPDQTGTTATPPRPVLPTPRPSHDGSNEGEPPPPPYVSPPPEVYVPPTPTREDYRFLPTEVSGKAPRFVESPPPVATPPASASMEARLAREPVVVSPDLTVQAYQAKDGQQLFRF